MGMKGYSGFFKGTNGYIKYKLDIQYFSSGKRPFKAIVLLKVVKNEKLQNTIKELYRPGAKVGDGSTISAIKKQIKSGKLVGGKDHIIKGKERVKNLTNLINSGKLNKMDKMIAIKLKTNLKKALGGK